MSFPRQIQTARLVLRDPRPADAPAVFAFASDPAVLRHLGWRPHADEADSARHIGHELHRWLKGSAWSWVLAWREGPQAGQVIGQIELQPQSHPAAEAHHLRLGYLLARAHWGQGLMGEAVAAVLDAALAQPAVWRVDALCDLDNAASARLLSRLGWLAEGVMRRAIVHPQVSDVPRDVSVWARVKGA
jgi:ribosomal-protein-alanine N-acetyltransferase